MSVRSCLRSMKLPDFKLERFFARYEFQVRHLMCCSDCESLRLRDLLELEEGAGERFGQLWLGYTESQGNPELRELIASLYEYIPPEGILVHSGAEEAIYNFMNAMLEPGDHVIVESPCYQSLGDVARSIGCSVTTWSLIPREGQWYIDIDELRDQITPQTRAIVINSPHNPTGHMLNREQINMIISLCKEKDLLLFADEVYRYLEYDAQDRLPWVCDLYDRAVSLGVMSKSFGLPGLRIGWIATQDEDIYRKMAAYKDYTSICNSAPSEFLASLALKNKDVILARNLAIIEKNQAILDSFFKKYEEIFEWLPPKAGPIAFPRLRRDMDAERVCERLVERRGVLLLPGAYYDYDRTHFRIGFGRAEIKEGIEEIDKFVREFLL